MHKFCSKKLFALVFCFILCLSLVLVACDNETNKEQPLQHEYIGDLISYVQETSQFQVYGSTTSYNDNVYYFEHTIPSQENDLCVNNTTKILEYLNCDKNISVTVFETNSYGENSFIDNNNIFTFRQDFNSAEYASLVVLAVFGKYCNYGLAYGYANYILNQVGLSDTSSTSLTNLNNDYLYDMNVLCFSEQYTDKDSVFDVKTFAAALVNDYIDKHGENNFKLLLQKTGDYTDIANAQNSLNTLYKDYGIEYSSTNILYTFGGKGNEFVAKSEFAEFFINDGWIDNANLSTYPGNFVDESFLHCNYNEVKTYFETITVDMRKFQEFFDMDEYNNDLTVVFYESTTIDNTSLYLHGNGHHKILLKTIMSLMHEYIHSLTKIYAKPELWAVEGFARRYSILFDSYSIDFLNYDYNHPDPDNPVTNYVDLYSDFVGRDIDITIDADNLIDFAVQYNKLLDINQSYASGASFIQYLEKQYGVQTAINYACSKNGEYAVLDKSLEELEAEWVEYLNESCAKYYK